jgi:hypothetical protein
MLWRSICSAEALSPNTCVGLSDLVNALGVRHSTFIDLGLTRATEHGLRVIKPWGDSSRYDFVVESGGRFLRVQVKSTSNRRRKQYACGIQGSGRRGYMAAEIDFFAIYVIPADCW